MNVSFEKVDKVNALVTIKIEKADYEGKVAEAIKDFRKKASIPGFRPGQVPTSLLKKRFGTEILAEQVNKVMVDELYKYIREQKINILGEPMPNTEKQQPVDFKTMEDFTFVFDVALAPEFDATVSDKDTLDRYVIDVTDEMVENQVNSYAQRGGHYDKVEEYQNRDMTKGILAQLDEDGNVKEDGVQVEGAVMLPDYIKNDEEKAKFAGCKVNDVLIINPAKAYDNSTAELSSLLKISKEEAEQMTSDFSYQITEITRYQPAELNQELFDSVLGTGVVNGEEEFRAFVKKQIEGQFAVDTEYRFILDLRAYMMDRVGTLEFPEQLLKRFMSLNNPEKSTEDLDKDFPESIKELQWYLIREKLCEQLDVKINRDDVLSVAKDIARMQFAQYGMINVPEETLAGYAEEMLKNKEQADNMTARAVEKALAAKVMATVTLNDKHVSLEEFNKLFEEKA
ncbi:MAG: trigger factor [Bacteroidaceae bacterium]